MKTDKELFQEVQNQLDKVSDMLNASYDLIGKATTKNKTESDQNCELQYMINEAFGAVLKCTLGLDCLERSRL